MGETSRSGELLPNQWTKVMWGWGVYKLTYQVSGTGAPFEVWKYTPVGSHFWIQSGGFFEFGPVGYGDVWFRSDKGGSYVISPFVSTKA